MTAVGQLFGRVADRVRRSGGPTAIAALDIGTEFAKALVIGVEHDSEGRLVGIVRGSGRQRQGLAHMQSGTVSDIDAVVANCRVAMEEARTEAGRRPSAAVIGIAGAIGAFGGFLIQLVLRQASLGVSNAVKAAATPAEKVAVAAANADWSVPALWVFLVSYVVFAAITWFVYLRRTATTDRIPSLAEARI